MKLKYTKRKTAGKGKYEYWVFRFRGKDTRLPGRPGDAKFLKAYTPLLAAAETAKAKKREDRAEIGPGTMAALICEYKEHPAYKKLGPSRKQLLDRCFDIINGYWGNLLPSQISPKAVLALQLKLQDTPSMADKVVGALRQLFKFGIPREYLDTNPAENIPNLHESGEGYIPWPQAVIEDVTDEANPMLRLAVFMHLYTGQRIQDVTKMQWSHVKGNKIEVASQAKTGHRLLIPLHPVLADEINRVEKNSIYILYGRYRQPFTQDALRDRLKVVLRALELYTQNEDANDEYHYHFHGLRKNAVNALLEAGCSHAQVSSITGQTLATIQHYAARLNREKLAGEAIHIARFPWRGRD